MTATGTEPQKYFFDGFTHGDYSARTDKEPRVRKARQLIGRLPQGARLLDVGCADGAVVRPFTDHLRIQGVDFAPSFVEQARKAGLLAECCDIAKEPLPFKDESFDAVFSGETMEHLTDTDKFLSEINRVLRPGGTLILTVPNVRTAASVLMMGILGLPPRFSARYRSPHYRDFTLRTVKLALAENGFALERARGTSFWLPVLGECWSGLAEFFPAWTGQMVLQARKLTYRPYDPRKAINVALY